MKLKGKKIFCFLALKHHSRFLLPITRALEAQGARILYLTAPAEMPFELTLQDEGLLFSHTQDYLEADVAHGIDQAYRQVRTVWKERVLLSSILHHFTLPVQDKILRMHVENFYLFRRMFEVEKPDLVLALHELNSWGKILGYLSHEFHVPMITLQEGLYYAPAAVYRFHTEYSSACLVWGEATREVLVRSGGSRDKIFVVGNTHLHSVIAREQDRSAVRRTRKELHVPRGNKVVTLLMGGLGYDKDFDFPQELLHWLEGHPQVVLVCKWHPLTNKLAVEHIAGKFQGIANMRMLQQFDTYRLLAASDICIVFGNSTTGLEALAFGKPLIEVQMSGMDYSFARQGVAEAAPSLAQVLDAVNRIFAGDVSADRAKNIEAYLQQNLHVDDGKSVERCVEIVEKMLAVQQSQKTLKSTPRVGEREEFLCSIIVPCRSLVGVTETLLGVAQNAPENLSYECLIPCCVSKAEHGELMSTLGGDVRLFESARPDLGWLYNEAVSQARGSYLCFLSPGWVPQAGWLEALLREMETDSQIGIAGGLALFADGLIAHAGITFDANLSPALLYRRLPATFAGANQNRPMRAVSGCLLVRRDAFLVAGGFDAAYRGRWCEIDFCLQTGTRGWKISYTPESLFLSLEMVEADEPEDRIRFFSKWVGNLWPDQGVYWAQDQTGPERLAEMYKGLLNPAKGAVGNLSI